MIAGPVGNRTSAYYRYSKGPMEYDYEHRGLMSRIMSHVITESKNENVQGVISTIENSLVFVMKYIGVLKDFKNYTKYNR